MGKFIVISFLLLGWAFYEASGGAEFAPELRADTTSPEDVVTPDDTPDAGRDVAVTRAASTEMTNIVRPVAASAPPPTPTPVIAPEPAPVESAESAPQATAPTAPRTAGTTTGVTTIAEPASFTSLSSPDTTRLREVAGARVNMRSGPSTDYDVLDTLAQGTQAELLDLDGNGWARVQIVTTGQIGWMAARLLTDG